MIDVALRRQFGNFKLDIAFKNSDGITALFGRSGSGKSTTIGLIAGLQRPDGGHVILDDCVLTDVDAGIFVPPHRRRIGLVFQDSHLFPHLDVKQNLRFGGWFAPRHARSISFDSVVETLGIGHLLRRWPSRLSGGERQRVAIGRALLSCPRLLLFDEPFAALDLQRRLEILPLIETLRDEFKIPIVYVSHAIEEVARLAACVVVLEDGRVKAIGAPEDVLAETASATEDPRFGHSSVLTARVGKADTTYGLTELLHPAGKIWLAGPAGPEGDKARIIIKATDVTLSKARPSQMSVQGTLAGKVEGVNFDGPLALVDIALDGDGKLFAMATRRAVAELGLKESDPVFALVKTVALDERTVARPASPKSDPEESALSSGKI
ncbi:MAG: molybdenum ABC transporter ATP-binding protein [Methylovirgula sp.]